MRSLNRCDGPTRVFVIAGNTDVALETAQKLEGCLDSALEVETSGAGFSACSDLRGRKFDLIVLDLDLCPAPEADVEAMVGKVSKLSDGALIVALSGGSAISDAMAAMRAGAHDHITKPIDGRSFAVRIKELAERHGRPGAVRLSPQQTKIAGSFHGFVGRSAQMRVVLEQIERIAASDAPAFITGESGTGKNLCAQALHATSPRADKPLIAINCGCVPRDRMETELFGVAKGAYTGADEDRAGAAEQAEGGTLFLDDIDALDLSLQTRLMRLLQTKTISRNGETQMRTLDVRIIAATRKNPMQLMSARLLREDLFYRLHVLPIHMPPLRQRSVDILPLAEHFLADACAETDKDFDGYSPEATQLLNDHELPGNVRQLQNLVRRVAVMFDGGRVTAQMLQAADIESSGALSTKPGIAEAPETILPMWRQEQNIIETTISHFNGNISQAAAALEISPSTIYRKRQSWEQMQSCQQDVA